MTGILYEESDQFIKDLDGSVKKYPDFIYGTILDPSGSDFYHENRCVIGIREKRFDDWGSPVYRSNYKHPIVKELPTLAESASKIAQFLEDHGLGRNIDRIKTYEVVAFY